MKKNFFKYYLEFVDEYKESGLISSIKKTINNISEKTLF